MSKGFSPDSPDAAKTHELPKDETQETIEENFEQRKKDKIADLEKTFEDAVSGGKDLLAERALTRFRELKEKQKKAVSDLYEQKKSTFREQAKQNLGAREKMADEILKSADDEAQKRIATIHALIEEHKKDVYITTEEAYEIEKACYAIEDMIKKDSNMSGLAQKISEGKTNLTEQEYASIVKLINPFDIMKARTDLDKTFEATSAGALIGIMKPDQRFHLVEVFMDSSKKSDTPQLLDSFMSTGILTRVQGEKLALIAVAKGLMTQNDYETNWKPKFESGYYQQEVEKLRKTMEEEKANGFNGVFSDNLMERLTGRPMVGGIMALWGTIMVVMNVAANMGHKGHRWQQLKTLKSNPYFYAGLAGIAGGTEIATGTLKKGSDWLGDGAIGRTIDTMSEKSEDETKTAFEKQMQEKMVSVYLNSPKAVEEYLDNGGFETLMALRKEKLDKKELPLIKIDELTMHEKLPTQITRLNDIKANPYVSQEKIESDLTVLAETAVNAGINGSHGFVAAIEQSKKAQVPGALASGMPTPQGPGFKPNV